MGLLSLKHKQVQQKQGSLTCRWWDCRNPHTNHIERSAGTRCRWTGPGTAYTAAWSARWWGRGSWCYNGSQSQESQHGYMPHKLVYGWIYGSKGFQRKNNEIKAETGEQPMPTCRTSLGTPRMGIWWGRQRSRSRPGQTRTTHTGWRWTGILRTSSFWGGVKGTGTTTI